MIVSADVNDHSEAAGQYMDPETGLIYLRNRYYDPGTAQFLTRDPIVALTRNAYGYVDGNPLNRNDPTGLVPVTCKVHANRPVLLNGDIFGTGSFSCDETPDYLVVTISLVQRDAGGNWNVERSKSYTYIEDETLPPYEARGVLQVEMSYLYSTGPGRWRTEICVQGYDENEPVRRTGKWKSGHVWIGRGEPHDGLWHWLFG